MFVLYIKKMEILASSSPTGASTMESVFRGFAVVSMLSSMSVLLTALLFPEMRNRLFMRLILYIALTNMLGCLVSSFGFPHDRSPLCTMQSFFAPYFFMSSWLWTTLLAHQLFTVATQARFGIQHYYMHAISWLLPLLLCLLPLSTNRYGRDDDDGDPTSWCYIAGDSYNGEIWRIVNYILPLCICLTTMIYYSARTFWLFYSSGLQRADLYATVHALMLYPLAMIITWGPNLLLIILLTSKAVRMHSNNDSGVSVLNASSILCTQSGTITAAIFFYKSREARYRWGRLLASYSWFQCCCYYCDCCNSSAGITHTNSSTTGSELKLSVDSGVRYMNGVSVGGTHSWYGYNNNNDIAPDFDESGLHGNAHSYHKTGSRSQNNNSNNSNNNYNYINSSNTNSGYHGNNIVNRGSLNTILLLMFGEDNRLGDAPRLDNNNNNNNNNSHSGVHRNPNNNNDNDHSNNNGDDDDISRIDTDNSMTDPLLQPYTMRGDSYSSNATGWGQYPDDDRTLATSADRC